MLYWNVQSELDGEATIDRDEQWDLIVEASTRLLERVEVGS